MVSGYRVDDKLGHTLSWPPMTSRILPLRTGAGMVDPLAGPTEPALEVWCVFVKAVLGLLRVLIRQCSVCGVRFFRNLSSTLM